MNTLQLTNILHRNSEDFVVKIDRLDLASGDIVCLLGPSGCGKSTTLRLAAGLEMPDAGQIKIGDRQVAGGSSFVPAEDRNVGLVFQDYALFPHLNVLDNVMFGLRSGDRTEKENAAVAILRQLGLADYVAKFPHELSGGEQQRVALARAMAPNPSVILMDEPFSGLDTVLRNHVRDETLRILKSQNTTTLLVTHDPEEAMRMADQIILMKDGEVVQQGTPAELYSQPKNEFVASFLGDVNKVPAKVEEGILVSELGQIAWPDTHNLQATADILVRPEAIRLSPFKDEGESFGMVETTRNLGPFSIIDLRMPSGALVTARAASILTPEVGEKCAISLDRKQIFLF
ncbi:ATP-binding cassette domain-containing protein [Sneathiella sp. P13V-1]|nr:ATP-binding cassette domain-containing protein [Sneathiella sp. P13V-1]